jgi:predicted nucleotide-binding protein
VLEKLALEAIILEEQAWRGRTVIEKFEEHSDAAEFAVVILSADDWGRGPDDADWTREKPNERART